MSIIDNMSENKIQQLAGKVNINRQIKFREALAAYGVSAGMSWNIWTHGATTRHDFYVIHAIERVLFTPAVEFLNDPEQLLPKKGN
jgi:hypothetical protein